MSDERTMREQVTAAISECLSSYGIFSQNGTLERDIADAALAAMREPTLAMGMAAADAWGRVPEGASYAEECLTVWQAMIDSATKGCGHG